ncbi:TPA: hypothetical protein RPG34_003371 [Yersinia enterocolitica]|nr:hypothetical protein [Yersinia enterocolitica]
MEEMRILALALFLCGLVFGFTFGMLCCLDEDRGYEFLPIPSPPVGRPCEPAAPLKTRVAHDDHHLAKTVRAKLKAQKERNNNANPRSNT